MRNLILVLVAFTFFGFESFAQRNLRGKAEADSCIALFLRGDFKGLNSRFDTAYRSYYSKEVLEKDWKELTGTYGSYASHRLERLESYGPITLVGNYLKLDYLPFLMNLSFNQEWKLVHLSFMPTHKTYVAPDYVNPANFEEFGLMLNTRHLIANQAVISVPSGKGPFPTVFIVGDAGPTDRDNSFENNKPYKDLAGALASNGFVVFRMDKRGVGNGLMMQKAQMAYESFTCREDYLDDLYYAYDSLMKMPFVDKDRLFVLGHGQGGILAPLVFKEKPGFKGAIMLGVNHKTTLETMIDQYNYLMKVTPGYQVTYEMQINRAKKAMDKKLKPLTPHEEMPYDIPATYWIWLNNYPHVKMAAKSNQAYLFLQGGRDYQTRPENLELWKKSMAKKKNAEYKLYPKLNHQFEEGDAESTYSEYFITTNLPAYLMTDIVDWLKRQSGN